MSGLSAGGEGLVNTKESEDGTAAEMKSELFPAISVG